ncbi:hypothetical protein LRR81_16495 [Metabacillus sp. GX 13764]|uniref:hypothetical protein n=1 Tax=Metabacillus kandeliae TaxID=2900151 RepID=UPI001E30B6B9|nr:hypothetical protein [Metabacillus kandeliae]MCD7035845.1 hypothetical protein [Metabacillus kandeliae]
MRSTIIQVKEPLTLEKIEMIENRLTKTHGIERVLIDIKTGSIRVMYDGLVIAPELMIQALSQHGMETEEVQQV